MFRGLFGGSAAPIAAAAKPVAAAQAKTAQQRPRGLFGGMADMLRENRESAPTGDRLIMAMSALRGDTAPWQQHHAEMQQQRSLAQQRFDELQAQEGQRNTAQKDVLQREQRAEALGLQGRERELFIRNGGEWASATGDSLYRDMAAGRYSFDPDNPNGVYLDDPVANARTDIQRGQLGINRANVNSQISDRNADNARLDQAAAREASGPRGGYTAAGLSDDFQRVVAPLQARENDLAYARSYQARLSNPDAAPDNTSDGALLTLVAGAIQSGVLTDGDVNRTVGTTATLFANRLQSFITGEGSLDDQTRNNLFRLADEMGESINEQRDRVREEFSTVARRNNINPQDVIGLGGSQAQAGGQSAIPDGTVIENDAGERMVRRNGRWERM